MTTRAGKGGIVRIDSDSPPANEEVTKIGNNAAVILAEKQHADAVRESQRSIRIPETSETRLVAPRFDKEEVTLTAPTAVEHVEVNIDVLEPERASSTASRVWFVVGIAIDVLVFTTAVVATMMTVK